MKSNIKVIISSLFVLLLMAGCKKDFLDRPPLTRINAETFYQTPEDLRLATAALYAGKHWAEWNQNSYLNIGDVLAGNFMIGYWGDSQQLNNFAVTNTNPIMTANWSAMYKLIAHTNATINAINRKTPATVADSSKNGALAEARFMRGFAYYNLALLWGPVPIVTNTEDLIKKPLLNRIKTEDVYKFATNDLLFAAQHLKIRDDKGRLTTWSAQGMLSKVYLTRAGLNQTGTRNQAFLDSAKFYAGNVIKKSGLKLLPNYADLFKTQFNDNEESLFALQWSPVTAGWQEGNMLLLNSFDKAISPRGETGWTSMLPTIDLYKQYAPQDSFRRKATFMLKGDHYPELDAANGGFKYMGESILKKHIIGNEKDNNSPTMTRLSSPEHNSLLRLADVYLIYAEAVLGNNTSTSDPDALLYVNKVRRRAFFKDPEGTELSSNAYDVTSVNADMLITERRVELAAEGQLWGDMVRLSYYNSPKAIQLLGNGGGSTAASKRVSFKYNKDTRVATPEDPNGAILEPTIGSFTFPIPATEVTANPLLLDAPVSYY
jgi:starch-binding outer membrane protein, SusD/RagB family